MNKGVWAVHVIASILVFGLLTVLFENTSKVYGDHLPDSEFTGNVGEEIIVDITIDGVLASMTFSSFIDYDDGTIDDTLASCEFDPFQPDPFSELYQCSHIYGFPGIFDINYDIESEVECGGMTPSGHPDCPPEDPFCDPMDPMCNPLEIITVPNVGIIQVEILSAALIGGEGIPINTTSLLVAGFNANSIWMIPAVLGLAGAGIVIFKIKRK